MDQRVKTYGLAALLGVLGFVVTRNYGVLRYAAGAAGAFVGYQLGSTL